MFYTILLCMFTGFIVTCLVIIANHSLNKRSLELRMLRKRSEDLRAQMDELEQIALSHFPSCPELSTIFLDEINVFNVRTNHRGES